MPSTESEREQREIDLLQALQLVAHELNKVAMEMVSLRAAIQQAGARNSIGSGLSSRPAWGFQ